MNRPRIELLSPPYAGHLHPILAIGRALAAFADVDVLSTAAAQARIRAAGLNAVEVLPGADPELIAIAEPPEPVGGNPLRLNAQLKRSLALQAGFAAALDARYRARRPGLLIADYTIVSAGPVAERHGIPWWTSHASPCVIEAPGGPPAYFGGWRPGRGAFGRLRDAAAARSVRGFKHAVYRLHRRALRDLGHPAPYRDDGSEAAYSPECILALGLHEFEFARDWPEAVRFVGPMLWSPPARIQTELAQTDAPQVLVTMGTHLGRGKDTMARHLDAIAARHPRWRIHFSDGRLADEAAALPGGLQRHAWVDYPNWIPRMSAVLHHGGAGVMWECLRAGVPALVLPQDYDQFDHAARLEAAGVALRLRHPREIEAGLAQVLDGGGAGLDASRFVEVLHPGLAENRVAAMVRAKLGC